MEAYALWEAYLKSIDGRKELKRQQQVSLASYSTFRIGGMARELLTPLTLTAFCEAVQVLEELKLPYFVLGNGSNVLFDDAGYDGVVLSCRGLRKHLWEGSMLHAQCGVPLPLLEKEAEKAGLSGLEFAVGIPACVGGAVCRNAGAFDGSMGELVLETVCYHIPTGKILRLSKEAHGFSYRYSCYQKKDRILLCAILQLTPDLPKEIAKRRENYLAYRRRTQPKAPSAGSVFLRQGEVLPAVLLDQAGCKGMTEGGAQVSPLHAGFIVNRGSATASDVKTLIERCKEKVKDRFGVLLQCEIESVGHGFGSCERIC